MSRPKKHRKKSHLKPATEASLAQSMTDRGRTALHQGDLVTAVRELTRAWSVSRNDTIREALADASRQLAANMSERGEVKEAAAELLRVAGLIPDDEKNLEQLTRLTWATGDVANASWALGKLIDRTPGHAGRLRALAVVRAAQGAPDSAEALLARLAAVEVDDGAPGWLDPLVRLTVQTSRENPAALVDLARLGVTAHQLESHTNAVAARQTTLLSGLLRRMQKVLGEELAALRHAAITPPFKTAPEFAASTLRRALDAALEDFTKGVHETLAHALPGPAGWQAAAAQQLSTLAETSAPVEDSGLPGDAPPGLASVVIALGSLLADDPAAALEHVQTAGSTFPPGLLAIFLRQEVARIASSRRAAGSEPWSERDSQRLERLAGYPDRLPEDLQPLVGRMLLQARGFAGAHEVLRAVAHPTPGMLADLARALIGLGRRPEALMHLKAALDQVFSQPAEKGEAPEWLPWAVATLVEDGLPQAEHALLKSRLAKRFPDAAISRRLNAVALVHGGQFGQALRELENAPPLLIIAAQLLMKNAPAALRALDAEAGGGDPALRELALHDWLDEDNPEDALQYLEERRKSGPPSGLFTLYEADLAERREAGRGAPLAREALGLAAADRRDAIDCADVLMRLGDTVLALAFLRTVEGLEGLDLLEAARAVAHLLTAGDFERALGLGNAFAAGLASDDERLAYLVAVISMLLDLDVDPYLPELELFAGSVRALSVSNPRLQRAVTDLSRLGWGTDARRVDDADVAFKIVRAHEETLPDRWSRRRDVLKRQLVAYLLGAEAPASDDPVNAPLELPAPARLVRDTLVAFTAAQLDLLAPLPRPTTIAS